jgi:hypothetical protein
MPAKATFAFIQPPWWQYSSEPFLSPVHSSTAEPSRPSTFSVVSPLRPKLQKLDLMLRSRSCYVGLGAITAAPPAAAAAVPAPTEAAALSTTLAAAADHYGGLIIDPQQLPEDPLTFSTALTHSLKVRHTAAHLTKRLNQETKHLNQERRVREGANSVTCTSI